MPALSKKQQKFMGIVRSIQKGEQPASKFNKDAQDVAKDMKKKDVKKFASTKHKGLPMKKEILGKLKELIKQELSEYTYGVGDVVKDDNPTCPHYGAQGKVKSVNPKSVVFVVTNKGDNFEPGQELEKSHDQMKKIGESINVDIGSGNVSAVQKGDDRRKKIATSGGDSKIVKEMSTKTKKIISKLGKKEKEMFTDMVDMLGFDQVMADYKRDKKAFKQALKDMSEGVIQEKFSVKSTKDYINNLDQAINLIVRQANNLKGPLAKHPIKRNVNKLKAVQTMLKKGFAPALYAYEKEYSTTNSYKAIDLTILKKKLQDGQFKSAVEYSLMPAIDTRGYDSNSFYYIKDKKEDKLRERLVDVLRDLVNKMDKAQLENINENKIYKVGDTISLLSFDRRHRGKAKVKSVSKSRANKFGIKNHYITNKGTFTDMEVEGTEAYKLRFKGNTEKQVTKAMQSPYGVILPESINEDGHTDVASSKRKVMIMVQDSNKLLNKLNGMNKEDSLPSWWTDKITLSQNYLAKATDYIINPVESVNEAKYKVHMRDKKRGNFELEKFQTGGQSYDYKKGMDIVKKLRKMSGSLEYKLVKESVKESMNPSAVKKMRDEFEKTGQLPPHLKKFALDLKILKKKHKVKNIVVPGLEWMSDMKESVNEASVSQVRSTLSRVKKQLMKKWAKKGGYENFGQKELRALKSKFKENPYGSPQERQISKMLDTFDNWAMNYSGDMKESVNEGKGVEKVLKMANDHSFGKLGGRTVDALSAGLFKGVYDKASDKNKEKINKMNEKQLYVFMTKLWSKFGNQVRIG